MTNAMRFSGTSAAFAALLALGLFIVSAQMVSADSVSVDFEDPPYTLGDINGQDGWSKTGAYDVEVDSSFGTTGFGAQSLRISNALTSGSFGDWTFAKPLTSQAGETGVGAESHYEVQFDIASAVPGLQQAGLQVSVAPDDGNGSRMSYLRFEDQADGVHVIFFDVTNPGPLGTVSVFNGSDIATLDRTVPHTVMFVMDFVDGPGNDVVEIWIDAALVHTGTSWEDYYRFDPEQNGNGNVLFPVDTLIMQARGNGTTDNHPEHSGAGFLFDNLSLFSGPTPVPPPPPPGGPMNSSLIAISVSNQGSITSSTSASASTGGNTAGGSSGGDGGSGGDVEANAFFGSSTGNNGASSAGDGGDGGAGGVGGTVLSGAATATADSDNRLNTTRIRVNVGAMNSSAIVATVDNTGCCNSIVSSTTARARTGGNSAVGSSGGSGASGGDVEANAVFGSSTGNNGGSSTGAGGSGGAGGAGGAVVSGPANATATSDNRLNRTRIRIN